MSLIGPQLQSTDGRRSGPRTRAPYEPDQCQCQRLPVGLFALRWEDGVASGVSLLPGGCLCVRQAWGTGYAVNADSLEADPGGLPCTQGDTAPADPGCQTGQ